MSRILVIDDVPLEREALSRLLTAAGHEPVEGADGRQAWLTMYDGAPDLILLDLMMPQMDGITFLRLLRHSDHWSHVPVIVVTGVDNDDQLLREARKLGVSGIMQKTSCDAAEILSRVEQTLAEPALPARPAAAAPARARRIAACVPV